MSCNVWFVIILLLIIIIIGLISFSNYNLNKIEAFTLGQVQTAQNIMTNNNQINDLLSQLVNANPIVQLTNFDPSVIFTQLDNNISSNINVLTNQLSNLYNSKITVNDTNLNKLENTVSDLENIVNNLGMNTLNTNTYNTIKSLNNGMEMKLVSTPNTVFQDYKTGSNIAGYMVMANNGCLSVGATDYDIYQCNDKNPKQIFKMENILNDIAYQNNIDTSLSIDTTDKSTVNYPFVMMKSINNENCLTNNHGNLTVQPCYSFVAQRWIAL